MVTTRKTMRCTSTSLYGLTPEGEMSPDQLRYVEIMNMWNSIRHKSREEIEASDLEIEWKEAHARFYDKYDRDMERIEKIREYLTTALVTPGVSRKSKGQRKREQWAKVQAWESGREGKK